VLYKDGKKDDAKGHLKKSLAGRDDFPGKDEAAATLARI